MMKRTSVLDFLGVVRIVGYSLALVAVLVIVALFLLSFLQSRLAWVFATPFTVMALSGLLVAWVAGLSRVFVRRMRFTSPQE